MRTRQLIVIGLLLLSAAGCQGAPTRVGAGRPATPARQGGSAAAPATPAVPLQGGASLLGVDAGTAIALGPDQTVSLEGSSLVGLDAGTFVSPDGKALVDASGKVLGSLEGATLIAAGGQNLVGPDAGSLVGVDAGSLIAAGGQNLIAAGGQNLIAAGGQNLIAAGGQNLIAAGGQNLVGPDAGSLIAAGGQNATGEDGQPRLVGALMGEVKLPAALAKGGRGAYRLAAEGVAPAADVAVYVRDAQGRFVVDATGRPISTRTDAEGRFLFRGHLAHRGLTCFVLLAGDARGLRGFAAMRPRDWRTGDRLPLDPVSTMLAGWIDTSILGSQAQDRRPRSLDRLTTDAATVARETLARKLGSAWAGAALDWRAETCAAETARIKQEGGAVAGALDAVQRIMTLAGIDNSQVETATRTTLALQQPLRLAVAPDGAVYVAERYTGLVRRFAADGTVSTVLGSGSPTQDRFGSLYACALTFANGQLYVAPSTADRVYRISADGKTVEAVSAFFAYAPSRRPDADLLLQALAPGLGGSLLYGAAGGSGQPARILRLKRQDGRDVVTAEDGPPAWGATPASSRLAALAEADDGALWAVTDRGETWLREPGGGWRKARHAMGSWPCDILTMPGGSLLCSFGNAEGLGKQELRLVGRDGSLTPYAGEGTAGLDRGTIPAAGAHFKLPAGLAALPDGTVLVADSQNGLVRAIKDGMVSTWAGTTTPRGTIAAEATLNLPGGIMVDAQGRVLLTEVGANAVRRLEGGNLTLVAGGEMAYADSPNQLGLLDGPASLAPHGDGILIGEAYGRRLRKLHPDGRLEVLVGGGTTWLRGAPKADQRVVAKDVRFAELVSVTVDPQGRPVFAAGHESYERAQIWRLEDDGSLTWLAGAFDRGLAMPSLVLPEDPRDGKPAKEVPISRLAGLAYDRAGNLYLAEPAAARVHRISPDGVFNTFAGTGLFPTVAALKDGTGLNEADVPARQASLLMPMGLAIDAQDRVYIAEVGTRVGAVMAARLSPEFAEDMPIVEGRVRVVTPDGIAHVLAGAGSGQQRGVVRNPIGVAVSRDGRLYVVDNGTAQLKEIVVTR